MSDKLTTKDSKTNSRYGGPENDHLKYWQKHDYEHRAEVLAIKRLLKDRHFKNAVDVGGGYGRLSALLEEYADKVTLAEPNQQQLDFAKDYLEDRPKISGKLMSPDHLLFMDRSVDLLTLIRVMHQLTDPSPVFAEVARVLTPDGYAIIEVANYMHAGNRLKHFIKRRRIPVEPVVVSPTGRHSKNEPLFVNHNPHTIMQELTDVGLKVDRILSVSNLRSTVLKKVITRDVMLTIEDILQPTLAKAFFGPSIFFFISRTQKSDPIN